MSYEKFRRTGELSDITVIVNSTEFKLHKFPLFAKSDYFKKAVASSTSSAVVELKNFPGGVDVFNQLADYFYSIPISIDHKNIVPLRSAACFIECDTLGALLDERFDKILAVARAKCDSGIPLVLLEQCVGEYQQWAKQAHIVDKCLEAILESLIHGASSQLSKSDREIITRLPLEWVIELIKLCPTESKLALLPFAKHYLTANVLEQNQNLNQSHTSPSTTTTTTTTTATENTTEHQSAFTPVARKEDIPLKTDDEKRAILDQIVKELGNTLEQLPLSWHNAAYEKAVELKCECEPILSSFITQSILSSSDLEDHMENISDDVMTRLLERVVKHKEEHTKDPHLLARLSLLIDSYIEQLRQRGTLTSEQFVKLASCIPKEQRTSYDSLLLALDDILKSEKSTEMSSTEKEELLNQIDFSRVNEETIAACKNNKLIPQHLITEAALALCAKLRVQLEETETRLRSAENELARSRPSYTSSSYRTRHYDVPTRHASRTRTTYTNSYELPISTSAYSCTKYDSDSDLEHVIPSKYLGSNLIGRYGTYSSYRY
ncbi:unnamed protein product [Adineta steineri]|uniref:BTB/POZ domain-containing protein n=1 Tax=Adineta steineri TaxID=433720 RepID=A0A815GDT9_9BILA|nr:unnamed protein product [Adineta steineri]CAF3690438.1 unnamed protein product [Adineta steineri]